MRMASTEVEKGEKTTAITLLDFVAKTSKPDCDSTLSSESSAVIRAVLMNA